MHAPARACLPVASDHHLHAAQLKSAPNRYIVKLKPSVAVAEVSLLCSELLGKLPAAPRFKGACNTPLSVVRWPTGAAAAAARQAAVPPPLTPSACCLLPVHACCAHSWAPRRLHP